MGKMEIATALKTARNYRGFTQSDAAKATNLTYQAISNFERGTNRVESISLGKLCNLYRISVKSVLDCCEWDPDYIEDFIRARTDDQRREILRHCGPCPRFICEYNDLLVFDEAQEPMDESFSDFELDVIRRLRRLTEEQRQAFLLILSGSDTQEP